MAEIHCKHGIEAMLRISSPALQLARVASGALDGIFARTRWARLGYSRGRPFGARSRPASMLTTLTGNALICNRPKQVHGALEAAGRARRTRRSAPFATGSPSSSDRLTSSASSALSRIAPLLTPPGRRKRSRPSTIPTCAPSSCTCTGCSGRIPMAVRGA